MSTDPHSEWSLSEAKTHITKGMAMSYVLSRMPNAINITSTNKFDIENTSPKDDILYKKYLWRNEFDQTLEIIFRFNDTEYVVIFVELSERLSTKVEGELLRIGYEDMIEIGKAYDITLLGSQKCRPVLVTDIKQVGNAVFIETHTIYNPKSETEYEVMESTRWINVGLCAYIEPFGSTEKYNVEFHKIQSQLDRDFAEAKLAAGFVQVQNGENSYTWAKPHIFDIPPIEKAMGFTAEFRAALEAFLVKGMPYDLDGEPMVRALFFDHLATKPEEPNVIGFCGQDKMGSVRTISLEGITRLTYYTSE